MTRKVALYLRKCIVGVLCALEGCPHPESGCCGTVCNHSLYLWALQMTFWTLYRSTYFCLCSTVRLVIITLPNTTMASIRFYMICAQGSLPHPLGFRLSGQDFPTSPVFCCFSIPSRHGKSIHVILKKSYIWNL